MKAFAFSLLVATSLASAQSPTTEFPEGAVIVTQDALKESLSGKVYSVKPASGPSWRWQFNANGFFFINVGNFSDSGKWSTKDSTLCSEGKQIKANCNEVRIHNTDLYLKRDNGEVVKLTANP